MTIYPKFLLLSIIDISFLILMASLNSSLFAISLLSVLFVIRILLTPPTSLSVFLLLFGPIVFGAVFQLAGINYAGTILALFLGLVLSDWRGFLRSISTKYNQSLYFAAITIIIVLIAALIYGPGSSYSISKLAFFIINFIVFSVAIKTIMTCKSAIFLDLGKLLVIGSIVLFLTSAHNYPSILPSKLFEFGSIRLITETSDITISRQLIAMLASYGLIFMSIHFVTKKTYFSSLVIGIFYCAFSIAILILIGQRLFILVPFISILCLGIGLKYSRKIATIQLITISAFVGIIIFALVSDSSYITALINQKGSILEKSNRQDNWNSAFRRISEHPIIGHGLGGYYVDGYSKPGEGTYPHNMILELLVETGVLGASIILIPLILMIYRRFRCFIVIKSSANYTVFPLLIGATVHSMVSHDLQRTSLVFAICFLMIEHANNTYYNSRSETNVNKENIYLPMHL